MNLKKRVALLVNAMTAHRILTREKLLVNCMNDILGTLLSSLQRRESIKNN